MALSKILPASQEQYAGARNLIINGAMQVAVRGTSTTGVSNATFLIDRFTATTTSGSIDLSQSTTAPSGFANSFKVAVNTTNAFATASDEAHIETKIEAQNLQHLEYGLSTAHKITLSFWVRSSVTGQYGVWFYQDDAGKDYSTAYTISSANTWEKKTITVDGNISDIINNDNGTGMNVRWFLDGGSNRRGTVRNSWLTTSSTAPKVPTGAPAWMNGSNDFYLTGIQLEVGETATPFEHRSYGDELARCQRYYFESDKMCGQVANASNVIFQGTYPSEMRATPSVSGGPYTIWQFTVGGTKTQTSASNNVDSNVNNNRVFNIQCGNFPSLTQYYPIGIASGGPIKFDAEL